MEIADRCRVETAIIRHREERVRARLTALAVRSDVVVSQDGKRYLVTVIREGGPTVRPEVAAAFRNIRTEITRRRKENHDKRGATRWDPVEVSLAEQRNLLDWIEAQLDKIVLL